MNNNMFYHFISLLKLCRVLQQDKVCGSKLQYYICMQECVHFESHVAKASNELINLKINVEHPSASNTDMQKITAAQL
jgi:hypothetical protein